MHGLGPHNITVGGRQTTVELLLDNAVRQAKLQEEVEIARRVQQALLPRKPALDGLELSVSMAPAEDIGGDCRQLDSGVFEQLLQPLYLTGTFSGDRSTRPSQITKVPDRLGWHERGPHQTVRAELGQPGRIGDIFSELKNS